MCSEGLQSTHVNLFRRPCVHAQGLDLGDMCAQLAVDCGAPHAQKDTHLSEQSVVIQIAVAEITKPTFQLAHPERLQVSEVLDGSRVGERTWGRGLAVRTAVISRNRADQFGQRFLIAQLLALANAIRHGERSKEWTQYQNCGW